jgi:hypothetical protein
MATETQIERRPPAPSWGRDPESAEAFGLMDRLDEMNQMAVIDPSVAARMVAGVRADTLVYIIPVAGKEIVGLSATGAQVLAAQRGGFETLSDHTEAEIEMPVEYTDNGVKRWKQVPATRVMVRVRDNRNDTTFIGVSEQAREMVLRDGGTRPDDKAFIKAFNKAERNALRKHFSALEDMVVEFARQARAQGKAYVSGAVAEDDLQAADEARANIQRLDMRKVEPLGEVGEQQFFAMGKRLAEEHGLPKSALTSDLKVFLKRTWGVDRPAQVPKAAGPQLYAWLNELAGIAEPQVSVPTTPDPVSAESKPILVPTAQKIMADQSAPAAAAEGPADTKVVAEELETEFRGLAAIAKWTKDEIEVEILAARDAENPSAALQSLINNLRPKADALPLG